jgi:pimeloyl-ACP methyl ester carboxylesterase
MVDTLRPVSETLFVDVEPDVRICVERWPAARSDAPTVLALHGFSSNRLVFAGLAAAFDGDVEVIAIDCRSRGQSSSPEDLSRYGMRRNADDAAAVLRSLGRRDVVVVGTSMCAWIATQVAAHYPDLVRALVLVDGGWLELLPAGTDPVEYVNGVLLGGLDHLDAVIPDLELAIAAARQSPGLSGIWDDNLEASLREGFGPVEGGVRNRLTRSAAGADATSYNDPIDRPYLRQDIRKISCPAHLITAPYGLPIDAATFAPPIMSPVAIEELSAALPQLTVEQTANENHFSVCIGPASNALVVPAVRRLLS